MTGIKFSMQTTGAKALSKKLDANRTKKPIEKGLRDIALTLEGLTKRATVVDTGRLRSSISSEIKPTFSKVGTMVQYAEMVEYGTDKMEARHMEGASKVLGKGMFAYGIEQLKAKMGNLLRNMGIEIERGLKK